MNIQPITPVIKENLSKEEYEKFSQIGTEALKQGKLAVCTLAGGQGTRLRTCRS